MIFFVFLAIKELLLPREDAPPGRFLVLEKSIMNNSLTVNNIIYIENYRINPLSNLTLSSLFSEAFPAIANERTITFLFKGIPFFGFTFFVLAYLSYF